MSGSGDTFPVHVQHAFLTLASRLERDISWAQGNSIWADSRRHGNDRASALTFGKAGGGTEEFPWFGLGGSIARVRSFVHIEKTLKIRSAVFYCWVGT